MPSINAERLIDDLKTLRSYGAYGNGVVRPSFSEVDIASRGWLVERMSAAGLDAQIDGVGNVIGRSRNAGKALLLGSHSDTQPTGGWLDGAMGVIYAVETARALSESDATRDLAVDIASWMDEEAVYLDCLGSASFTRLLPDHEIRAAKNAQGETVAEAIEAAGLGGIEPARFEAERHFGYLEAHIEQGPLLEAERKRIGVVTAIVGIRTNSVIFIGQQNHAGTTPMHLRADAGDALIEFSYRTRRALREQAGDKTVFTIGRVQFEPGADAIIPGRAEMGLQYRDPDDARLDAMEAAVQTVVDEMRAAGPVEIEFRPHPGNVKPATMSEDFQRHFAVAAERLAPGQWMHMPSGAGHDAQLLAERMPAGMLFVPSIGGISHDFAEDTAETDIVLGCQVFAAAAASILEAANPR